MLMIEQYTSFAGRTAVAQCNGQRHRRRILRFAGLQHRRFMVSVLVRSLVRVASHHGAIISFHRNIVIFELDFDGDATCIFHNESSNCETPWLTKQSAACTSAYDRLSIGPFFLLQNFTPTSPLFRRRYTALKRKQLISPVRARLAPGG